MEVEFREELIYREACCIKSIGEAKNIAAADVYKTNNGELYWENREK